MPNEISEKFISEKIQECLAELAPTKSAGGKNPNASGVQKDTYNSRPKPQAPTYDEKLVTLFWQNPLAAKRVNQCIMPYLPQSYPAQTPLDYTSFYKSVGGKRILFKIPQDTKDYLKASFKELLSIIEKLNGFMNVPVRTFVWDISKDEPSYDPNKHEVHLFQKPPPDINKTVLVHEMGHAIYAKNFAKDDQWKKIFEVSLRNDKFEIIRDSNYKIAGRGGHPWDDYTEAFASSVHAFFLKADAFASYIQSPETPLPMREFGKLVWVFMRDKVFKGKVFTSDRKDPFFREKLDVLLNAKWVSEELELRSKIKALFEKPLGSSHQ